MFDVRTRILVWALLVAVSLPCPLRADPPAEAKKQQTGKLEGIVRMDKPGTIPGVYIFLKDKDGKELFLKRQDGEVKTPRVQWELGGFYEWPDVPEGVYEVRVALDQALMKFRPQRIHGVVIKAGVRNKLDILLHAGTDELEEIGKPAVVSEKVMVLTEEIQRLRLEIEALKKEVEQLRKK